ncbi:hypothetical protein ACZ90_71095 [Streptomyces albus subsp. albus]|nr:hypothetical protein ACZ90_71095 [Streptomyces albus subsp. albus]
MDGRLGPLRNRTIRCPGDEVVCERSPFADIDLGAHGVVFPTVVNGPLTKQAAPIQRDAGDAQRQHEQDER